jgi:hypothetical protein
MSIFGRGYGFKPTQLNGCVLWLRADRGIALNGGAVQAWADQSGNGHDVGQATGAKQPTLNTSDGAYDSQATLSFASANSQSMSSAAFSAPQPFTQVVVGNFDAVAVNEGMIDWQTGGETTIYNNASATQLAIYAGTPLATVGGSNANPFVVAGVFSGASSSIYVNSSQVAKATGNAGTGPASGGVVIGGLQGPSSFLNGKIAEVIIYNRPLDTRELGFVFRYFAARYGLVGVA